MTGTALTPDRVFYPESDGQPIAESDATRDYLLYCVEALKRHFRSRSNVYVSGNLFVYYEAGNPKAVISPDVFVIFGVSNRNRRIYQAWKEGGKLPAFVLEVTSKTTRKQDQDSKPRLYAQLGVQEYFQYDPTADYLTPQLQAAYLSNGVYRSQPLQHTAEGIPFIHSSMLGLDLQLHPVRSAMLGIAPLPQELRFYDPQTGQTLPSRADIEEALDITQQELDTTQQELDTTQQELDTAQQELDTTQQERDKARQERDAAQVRAVQLAERLKSLGIDPDQL